MRENTEAARGCVKRDNTDVIRLLLDDGANAKIADESGYTPLHRAAGLCEPETIGLLLQRGADPNVRDTNQVTPLISAAASGKLENLRLLINAGAAMSESAIATANPSWNMPPTTPKSRRSCAARALASRDWTVAVGSRCRQRECALATSKNPNPS